MSIAVELIHKFGMRVFDSGLSWDGLSYQRVQQSVVVFMGLKRHVGFKPGIDG